MVWSSSQATQYVLTYERPIFHCVFSWTKHVWIVVACLLVPHNATMFFCTTLKTSSLVASILYMIPYTVPVTFPRENICMRHKTLSVCSIKCKMSVEWALSKTVLRPKCYISNICAAHVVNTILKYRQKRFNAPQKLVFFFCNSEKVFIQNEVNTWILKNAVTSVCPIHSLKRCKRRKVTEKRGWFQDKLLRRFCSLTNDHEGIVGQA